MTMNEREKAAGLSGTTSNYGKPTPTMSEREAAAGLSNTTSNYGKSTPTMDEREAAAGLSGTTSNYGRSTPTMDEREAAAGLSNTTSNYGRRDWSQDNVNSDESVSSGTRVETIRSDSVLPDNSNFRGIVGIAVVKEDESNVIVTEGSVENELFDEVSIAASDGMSIWIKCTLPSEGSPPNAVSAVTSDPGNDTDTKTSRLWATISIDNGFLTVTEHRRGSPDLDSCGSNHVWIF